MRLNVRNCLHLSRAREDGNGERSTVTEKNCAANTLLSLAMGALAVVGAVAVVNAVKRCMPRVKAQMESVGEDCKDCCEGIGKAVKTEVADCAEKIREDLSSDHNACDNTHSDTCEDC